MNDGRYARCEVGFIRFIFSGFKSLMEGFPSSQIFINGVCLVAVGNDGVSMIFSDGIVNDQ